MWIYERMSDEEQEHQKQFAFKLKFMYTQRQDIHDKRM